ncbi:hypothetical protein [Streptomyces sp. NRRL S-350]|uniref:hypothetical protein n=1 Tax=Streptomyces sp. NRRL S-350 TaxID=1463902 RepID=UPI0004BF36FA|nr:hypothetical protein [Streptomyces sp. NRRL S-350]
MQSGGAELNVGCPGGRPGGAPVASVRWPRPATGETVDQLGAAERCETLLQDTLDALDPAPAWQEAAPRAGARLSQPGRGSVGWESELLWYVTRGRDLLTVVSLPRRPALVGAVERHWRRRGWTITSLNAGRDRPGVGATTRDGYRLELCFGELGEAGLTAGSPGVARSERLPVLPGGDVFGSAPLPYVCCPYWSALL